MKSIILEKDLHDKNTLNAYFKGCVKVANKKSMNNVEMSMNTAMVSSSEAGYYFNQISSVELASNVNYNFKISLCGLDKDVVHSNGDFTILQNELMMEILFRLPLPHLSKVRLVCRRWAFLENNASLNLYFLNAVNGDKHCKKASKIYERNCGLPIDENKAIDLLKKIDSSLFTRVLFDISCLVPKICSEGTLTAIIGRFETIVKLEVSKLRLPCAKLHLAISRLYMTMHDDKQAVQHSEIAAQNGCIESQLSLSEYYCKNNDIKKMVPYLNLAVKQNINDDLEVIFRLGCIYNYWRNRRPDFKIGALNCFGFAADKGHLWAQFEMGEAYRDGILIPHDLSQARHYYKLAANQGCTRAIEELAKIADAPADKSTVLSK